jgi:ATP-dependent exoDNAse (exonuclease V) alpha subunit
MCTTTGAAALRLCPTASTAHTLFRIPSRGYLSPLQEPSIVLERLQMADVIIVDEMSMMTSYMLSTIEHRLKQAAINKSLNALCNKLVFLVGDLAQLPAICIHSPKSPDILCRGCHITSAPCWATAKHHTLRMSVRHATDPTYLQFLNIIRERVPTELEIETTLGECFITEEHLQNHIHKDTTILCSHREDVMKYNEIVFKKKINISQTISVKLDTKVLPDDNMQYWLDDARFIQLHIVAIGALVMFTENVSISKGAVNGATAIVTSINLDTNQNVTNIIVQITNTGKQMIVKRSTFEHVYTFGKKFYKSGFPIVLAYAMTGHKSQGATISTNVVVDIRNAFAPGLTYVMLSRVTNRTNLKIKGRLIPSDFIPCKL